MAEIKGVLIDAWLKLLRERYGEQAVAGALARLTWADRELLSGRFLPSSWYPFDTLHALRRLTRPLASEADVHLATEIGRFMAQEAATGVYRSLLAKDPLKQAERLLLVEELLFRGARKMEVEITGSAACLVRYRYERDLKPTGAICGSHLGFFTRMLELSGASKVKGVHSKCAARRDRCCEFAFEWEAAGSRPDPGALPARG